MLNLFEIMQSAQGGKAYNNLAQQFGIGQDQARQAVEAVLPAFSLGLQQQAQTVEGWQKILATLSQSQGSAATYDSDGDGIPDHLETEGQGALGNLFGGPQVTQAVAQNAAQFAGLPATMMKQMLPVIASMIIGGLFKGAANNGLGGILGQMMQGNMGGMGGMFGGGQPQAQPPGGVFGQILGGMFGGQPAPQPQAQPGFGPLGDIIGQMLGSPSQPQAAPAPTPQAAGIEAGLDMLKGMFETGKQVQGSQMQVWEQILGQLTQKR